MKKIVVAENLLFCVLIVLSRIFPHPANLTPVFAFLMMAAQRPNICVTSLMVSWICSDILLGVNFSSIGSWMFFTDSAILIMLTTARYTKTSLWTISITGTLFFWGWTNLGVFLTGDLYTQDFSGFIKCYLLALPFLKNSLLGTVLGIILIKSINQITTSIIRAFILRNREKITASEYGCY